MMMPKPPTRAALRAFWVLVSVVAGLVLGVGLTMLDLVSSAGAVTVGVLAVVGLAGFGIARPYAVSFPYRVWNWLAAQVAARLRTYVTGVCFFTVVLAAGRAGSAPRFLAASSGESMWTPRESQALAAYASQCHDPRAASTRGRWTVGMRRWARRSGNHWALAVVPFLVVLRLLDTDEHQGSAAPTSDIYTLY